MPEAAIGDTKRAKSDDKKTPVSVCPTNPLKRYVLDVRGDQVSSRNPPEEWYHAFRATVAF